MQMAKAAAKRTRAAAFLAGLLAGCAATRGIAPASTPLQGDALEGGSGLAAAVGHDAAWPADGWWKDFHDRQLDALIDTALAGSPQLRVARDRIAEAQASTQAAQAAMGPTIEAQAQAQREHFSKDYLFPPPLGGGNWWDNQAAFKLSYSLDLWGRDRAAWLGALGAAEAAGIDARAARLSLESAVIRTYVRLSLEHALDEVLRAQLEQRRQILDITRRRRAAGLAPDLELSLAEAQVPPLEAQLEHHQATLTQLRNALAALCGQGPGTGERIARPQLSLARPPALPSAVPAALLGRRPDVVAARWRVEAASRDIDVARAQFYPNVNLVALAGVQSIALHNLFDSDSIAYGGGPALTLPVFEGGRLRANLAGRSAAYDAAVDRYDQILVEALRDVADRVVASQSLAREQAHADQALAAAQRAYEQALTGFRAGLTDFLAVLQAENGLLAARRALAEIVAAQLDARVLLIESLGGGFEDQTDSAAVLEAASARHPAGPSR
jgi:NodT family efflux transporter outer membrane factor (OMF) lipoprotein